MKKSLLLMLFLALTWSWTAKATDLTVCEGTDGNSYLPAYGLYVDTQGSTSEFIIPATTQGMSDMANGSISKLTFYLKTPAAGAWTATIQVYVMEVGYTTLSSVVGPENGTVVYTGTLDATGSSMEISLDAPYTYNGGNLLIGTYVQVAGNYKSATFYGVNTTGAGYHKHGTSASAQGFIPKTTFEYTIEAPSTCEKPSSLVASDVEANSAVLTWDGGSGTYNVEYKKASAQIWTSVLGSSNLTTTSLSNLEPLTSYQARVQSVCTEDSSSYKMVSFTTPCGAYPIPFSYGFEVADTFACWNAVSGVSIESSHARTGSKNLKFQGAKPLVILPAFANPINTLRLEIWARPESTTSNSGKLEVGYVTDPSDTATFVAVATFVNTDWASSSYEKKAIDFDNAPAGATMAMRQHDHSSSWYWFVDDITVKAIPSCLEPTDLSVSKIKQTEADLSWTANSNESSWMVYYKKATAEVFDSVAVSSNSFTLNGLEAATNYQFYVVAKCSANEESEASAIASFTTACPEFYAVPFVENFDNTASAANSLPLCWSYINTTTNTTYAPYPRVYNGSTSSLTGNNHLRFNSYMSASSTTADPKDQYAILPKMDNIKGLRMKLFARANSASTSYSTYDATFFVGVMTDPTDATSFESMGSYTPAGTNYELFTIPFGDYSGGLDGGGYIAIKIEAAEKLESGSFYRSVFIDSIVVEEIPSCLEPINLALATGVDSIGTNFAILKWTSQNESSESAWKLEYKLASAADWTALPEAVSSNPYTLQGLQHSSTYDVRVAAWCDPSNPDAVSGWSEPISFQTECAAISQFPWSEDFDSYAAGEFEAPCWVNERIVDGTGTSGSLSRFKIASHQLQLPDMKAGTLTKLALPEMTLPDNNYQFVLDINRNASGTSYPEEGIRVYASTDGEIEGATELAFISRNCTQTDGGLIPAESTTGWYTYELPIGISGTCYIILRGESKYGSATYIDNFSVEAIPSCKRPSSPKSIADLLTAHTATLTWTKGDSLQTAWQIAVDTLASFNPDSVGIRIVNASKDTFKINGLDANTQYYAYVRANCEENSPWSKAKASFKTVIGNKVPTNLAVIDSTITSSSATIKWKGVASNDNHQSFELYYSKSNSDPDPTNAQSLITGITDTLYTLDNLDADSTYYIWVRDNCGTDSLSAWSPRKSFKTASACETPDGLDANEIGVDSAIISWNTYGLTDFNLRYKADTAGAAWSDPVAVAQPHVITGLAGNTVYKVQVQPTCNLTVWSDSMSFRTECDAISTLPYSYDFETTDKFYCWTPISGTVSRQSGTTHDGSYRLDFRGTTSNMIALPQFSASTNTLRLEFWTRPESKSAPSGSYNYSGKFAVGYLTNIDSANTFVAIDTFSATDWATLAYEKKIVDFNKAPAGAVIALRQFDCSTNYYWYVDDVTVKEIPSCLTPTEFVVSTVATTSAVLNWTAGGIETAWEICLNGDETNLIKVNAKPYTLNGLTEGTSYSVKVRAACSDTDKSEWSSEILFATKQVAVNVPFSDDFEGESKWLFVNGNLTNAWVLGDATSKEDGGHSLYISNDGGTTNAYTNTSAAMVYATKNFHFEAGKYVFAYDWKANGESTYDYLRVALVPESVELSAATETPTGFGTSSLPTGWIALDGASKLNLKSDWQSFESAVIEIATAGNYKVVLAWRDDTSTGTNPPAAVDNFKIFKAHQVGFNASGYATFYDADNSYKLPAELTGHVFSTLNSPMLQQEYAAGAVIPAATPVVLKAEEVIASSKTYTLLSSEEAGSAPKAFSQLQGVNVDSAAIETSNDHEFFVLSLAAGEPADYTTVGFYYYSSTTIHGGFPLEAHKAFLKVPTSELPSGAPAAFYLFNGENGATWLENLEGVEGTLKFLHEGKIFILREGVIYDATGRQVRKL